MKKIFGFLAVCLLLLSANNFLMSQTKGFNNLSNESIFKDEASEKFGADKLIKGETIPVGNVIEPEFYRLGPGDILAIQNMSISVMQQYAIVTPENTLIIPRIGAISVKGQTLSQVRDTIMKLMKERNASTLAYVTLYQPRTVLVTIRGNTQFEGTYNFPASYRISSAIKASIKTASPSQVTMQESHAMLAYRDKTQETEKQLAKGGLPFTSVYSKRNISIIHSDGTNEVADVEKALITSNPAFDPYLREGDEIYIPFEPETFPVISISGAVRRPSSFVWKKGDKASLLLKLGLGLSDNANIQNIQLRYSNNDITSLSIDSALNIIGSDPVLKPGASIIVGVIEEEDLKSNDGLVAISGCVKHPGVYNIKLNETRIKDVVDLAGGFTNDAYLPLARILRRNQKLDYTYNIQKYYNENFQYSDLTLEDSVRFKISVDMKSPIVSCDFVSLFKNNSTENNVFLINGDLIDIPSNPKSVFVWGNVIKPGFVPFDENQNMKWYIAKAGGISSGAKENRARIIRGNNKVWVEGEDKVPVFAGDEIFVPRAPDLPPGVELQTWSLIVGALGATAALINVIVWGFLK
ncbi:MAG: SLBB domain-containing protein [Bacteroidota bacterium]